MLQPSRMKRIKIVGLETYREQIIQVIHDLGLIQICNLGEQLERPEWKVFLGRSVPPSVLKDVISCLAKIDRTLEILESIEGEKGGTAKELAKFFMPERVNRIVVENIPAVELISKANNILNEIEARVEENRKKIENIENREQELRTLEKIARDLLPLNIDFEHLYESELIYVTIGKTSVSEFTQLNQLLDQVTNEEILVYEKSLTEKEKIVLIASLQIYKAKILETLRKVDFDQFEFPKGIIGSPLQVLKNIEQELKDIDTKGHAARLELQEISQNKKRELYAIRELLEIEKEREEICIRFGKTEQTFVLDGWIPAKEEEKVVKALDEVTNGFVIVRTTDPTEHDEVPIQLENSRIFRPFEWFIEAFSPPRYNEIDPTPIFAITFPIFFGMCLPDAGYGITIAAVFSLIALAAKETKQSLSYFCTIIAIGGIWSIIWGFLVGEFFGETIEISSLWHKPLENPVMFLVVALVIGVIHQLIGLAFGIYQHFHERAFREGLGDQIARLLLLIGIIFGIWSVYKELILIGKPLNAQNLMATFTHGIGLFSIILVLASLVLVVGFTGAIGILELPVFFSNLVSYSRLFALLMATGAMSIAASKLSLMSSKLPVIGAIAGALIFILIHGLDIVLGGLEAFIQPIRLHYLEFFNRFYSGMGQKFTPFKAMRKLTLIK
ncbi:MAG: V-type ATP synthase subunit I [Euryarchaeota archaeon]|nr:V-type ATP synthase subunit I [Euryarchaeota archaeon]